MRVWLIQWEGSPGAPASMEPLLRGLSNEPEPRLALAGVSPPRADLAEVIRATAADVIVGNLLGWDATPGPDELIYLGLPLMLVGHEPSLEPWRRLASTHAVGYAPASVSGTELVLALWTLLQGFRREQELRLQVQRLQQRLSDRIVIDKAKGVLMQRLGILEQEAYQRLRAQSRRQRKQMREIAQSVLDAQFLLDGSEGTEAPGFSVRDAVVETTVPFPQRPSRPGDGSAERRQQG